VLGEENSEGRIHPRVQARGGATRAWWRAAAEGGAGTRGCAADAAQLEKWEASGKLGGVEGGKPVTPEQMEISRLRAENARLRMEAEILKKAAAYFAKESL